MSWAGPCASSTFHLFWASISWKFLSWSLFVESRYWASFSPDGAPGKISTIMNCLNKFLFYSPSKFVTVYLVHYRINLSTIKKKQFSYQSRLKIYIPVLFNLRQHENTLRNDLYRNATDSASLQIFIFFSLF